MIYSNFEGILNSHLDIENKYALASIISKRASVLRERNGDRLVGANSGNFITQALEELGGDALEIEIPKTVAKR